MNDSPLLQIQGLCKSFKSGNRTLNVLQDAQFHCNPGEVLAIMGPSGCGKTTLLNLISGLDRVDKGKILYRNKDLVSQNDKQWDQFRRNEMGMIFQFNQLLPEFTALENTMLPFLIAAPKNSKTLPVERASDLLSRLGLGDRLSHRPSQLSGGEQQRVAIARALMNKPRLILADEPTGSLDFESGLKVFQLLRDLQEEMGFSCLIVTHSRELAAMCDRIISLKNEDSSKLV